MILTLMQYFLSRRCLKKVASQPNPPPKIEMEGIANRIEKYYLSSHVRRLAKINHPKILYKSCTCWIDIDEVLLELRVP